MRIGYFTDLHYRGAVPGTSPIAKRESRRVLGLLEDCLADIFLPSLDLLVCTGDLVDDPRHPAAPKDLTALRDLIRATGVPSIILPGNHDPAPETFYQVFERPSRVTSAGSGEIISFCEDVVPEGEQACTRAPGALAEMGALLDDPMPGWTLLLQHYLIWPERNEGYPHNYVNAAAIRGIMEDSPQPIISLSGHYHPGCELAEYNGLTYLCGSAFCEAPHRYYILTLERSWLTVETLSLD